MLQTAAKWMCDLRQKWSPFSSFLFEAEERRFDLFVHLLPDCNFRSISITFSVAPKLILLLCISLVEKRLGKGNERGVWRDSPGTICLPLCRPFSLWVTYYCDCRRLWRPLPFSILLLWLIAISALSLPFFSFAHTLFTYLRSFSLLLQACQL